ncbi:MAG: phosphatase [Clostridium sp.]|uniref:phosphatase n=1 Tax=Clostridium sp. TaxID=1506 RepID=UPI002FCBC018
MKPILDLHVHTVSSGHAYSTVKENIEEAAKKGIKYLGISDHAPSMPGAPHLFHFYNLRVVKDVINGVRILKGIEANIVDYDGSIDVPEDLIQQLDYVIASIHSPCFTVSDIENNTNALISAMENPFVKIIGHPDDSRVPVDYVKVVEAAKRTGTILEINNSSIRPGGYREGARENLINLLNLCKENKVMVIMGTDSHIYYEIGDFTYAEEVINSCDFPKDLVLNYQEDPLKFLKIK